MRKLDSKRDLPECGRIATAILDIMSSASTSGAGHPPVTLDANAATVLTIGADPTSSPQELGLETQVHNTVWAGPADPLAADAVPTFRALVADDISSILPKPVAQGDMLLADATPAWAILTTPGAAGYALVSTAVSEEWDPTPIWADLHTFTGAPAIEIDLASGDPVIILDTQGADKFTLGVDDSDSDKFKINSGGALADPSDFEMDSDGNVEIGGDFNLLTGKGIVHADGVTAGNILRADGTRYIPAAAAATIPFAPTAQGDMIAADGTPEWARLALSVPAAGTCNYLGVNNGETDPSWKSASANPGAAAVVLQSDASGLLQLVGLGVGATPGTAGYIRLGVAVAADTADGSDSDVLYFSGGGGVGVTRGAYVAAYGNEHASKQGRLELVAGDDAADGEIKLFTGNAAVAVTVDRSQQVGIGDASPDTLLDVEYNSGVTDVISDILTVAHNTSGTAADLFGGALKFELESSTTANQDAGNIAWMWSDATHASRNSLMRFNTYNAGVVVGYFGIASANDVAGVAITIIPGGDGDVTGYIWIRAITVESAGGVDSVVLKLEPGDAAADLYNDGVDVCQLTVGAGGDVTVVRSAGAATFDVQLIMGWI